MRALSIGAVLWDIIEEREYIGGAPFNLAVNLRRLGAKSAMLTGVGEDERGERTLRLMRKLGVDTRFVQIPPRSITGIAEVTLDEQHNAAYRIPPAAFDEIRATSGVLEAIAEFHPDVVCFGSIEQRGAVTRRSLEAVLKSLNGCEVFFDANLRMDFVERAVLDFGMRHSTILKINEDESAILSRLFVGKTLAPSGFSRWAMEEYGLKVVLITLGGAGCYLRWESGEDSLPACKRGDGDTVGAGDAFSAAFLYALTAGAPPRAAAVCGNLLGGYVASRTGALPPWDDGIRRELEAQLQHIK